MTIKVNDKMCAFETQCLNNRSCMLLLKAKNFLELPSSSVGRACSPCAKGCAAPAQGPDVIRCLSHPVSCLSSPVLSEKKPWKGLNEKKKKKRETFSHIYFCSGDKSLQELLSPLLTGNKFTKQNDTRYHSDLIGWNRRSNTVQGLTVKF